MTERQPGRNAPALGLGREVWVWSCVVTEVKLCQWLQTSHSSRACCQPRPQMGTSGDGEASPLGQLCTRRSQFCRPFPAARKGGCIGKLRLWKISLMNCLCRYTCSPLLALKLPEVLCKLSGVCLVVALGVPSPCTEAITVLTPSLNCKSVGRAVAGTGTMPL